MEERPFKRPRLSCAQTDVEPDIELQEARYSNDLRLKSVFEGIFEKYGKDFSGVGDEIDLETGAIVVNNGHLQGMLDEQDVGEDRGGPMEGLPEESWSLPGAKVADEAHSDDEYRASKDQLYELPTGATRELYRSRELGSDDPQMEEAPESTVPKSFLPSDASIMEQFGEEIGPRVIQYVAQLHPISESQVESVWQTPGSAPPLAKKRPIIRSLFDPQNQYKPFRPDHRSIWALPKTPRKATDENEVPLDRDEADILSEPTEQSKNWPVQQGEHLQGDWVKGRACSERRTSKDWAHQTVVDGDNICANCGLSDSLWRRDRRCRLLCNRCRMYQYKYGVSRPAKVRLQKQAVRRIKQHDDRLSESSEVLGPGNSTSGGRERTDKLASKEPIDMFSKNLQGTSLLQILFGNGEVSGTETQAGDGHSLLLNRPQSEDIPLSPSSTNRTESIHSASSPFPRASKVFTRRASHSPELAPNGNFPSLSTVTDPRAFQPKLEGVLPDVRKQQPSPPSSVAKSSPPVIDLTSSPEPEVAAPESVQSATNKAATAPLKDSTTPKVRSHQKPKKVPLFTMVEDSSEDELMTPTRIALGKSPVRRRMLGNPL